MHRIVAVVDIGPAVFAELDLERDLSARTQPPHVLADKALRCRNGVVAAIDRNAFLEVQMDRVIPSAAAVDVGGGVTMPETTWMTMREANALADNLSRCGRKHFIARVGSPVASTMNHLVVWGQVLP